MGMQAIGGMPFASTASRLWRRPTGMARFCTVVKAALVSDLPDIPSPCIGICRLDRETRQCEGCLRTAREIARWPYADNTERLTIVNDLRERRRARGRTSAADSRPRRRARVK